MAAKQGDAEAMAQESLFFSNRRTGARPESRLLRNYAALAGGSVADEELKEQFSRVLDTANGHRTEAASGSHPVGDGAGVRLQNDTGTGDTAIAIRSFLSSPGDPEDEALLKDDLTADELRQVMHSKAYNDPKDPRFGALNERVGGWFEDRHGDTAVRTDAAGRRVPVDPPETPMPASVSRTGTPLPVETARLMGRLFPTAASRSDVATRVAALQNALNRDSIRFGGTFADEALRTDGIAGPKTRRAFRLASGLFRS